MKPPVSRLETPSPLTVTFEAVMPAAMAVLAEESGIKRASLDPMVSFVLSVLAGAFVAFGAIFATTVLAGTMTTFTADGTLASSAVLPMASAGYWPALPSASASLPSSSRAQNSSQATT